MTTYQPWRYRHVHAYLAMCKWAFGRCRAGGRVRLEWSGESLDLAAFRRVFWRALDVRINLKVAPEPAGRWHDDDNQRALRQDARDVREILTRRVRVYQFRTSIARRRLGHLLSRHDD